MAYVDLNPIRAGMAGNPEASDYTSIQARIRQFKQQESLQPHTLRPFRRHRQDEQSLLFSLTDYLDLVDWTGRVVRTDKRGAIPDTLPSILIRLNIDPEHWLSYMQPRGNVFSHAIGRTRPLKSYALSLGQLWLHGEGPSQHMFFSG